jgi:AIPR protein
MFTRWRCDALNGEQSRQFFVPVHLASKQKAAKTWFIDVPVVPQRFARKFMSALHLSQIRKRLEQTVFPYIDMHDQRIGTETYEQMQRSRALAAYIVHHLTSCTPEDAAKSLVDGSGDNGVDAIYFQESDEKLYVVQAKWFIDGKGEPDNGSVKKFTAGIRDLTSLNFERFNEKIQKRAQDLDTVLSIPTLKIIAVLVHSGNADLSDLSARDLDDVQNEINDASDTFDWIVINQKQLHLSLSEDLNSPITAEIPLQYWGKVSEPRHAIYGMVSAADLGQIWHDYKDRLVAKNLRGALGDSDVNKEIRATLEQRPDQFWYFNNGITATARSVKKLPKGGVKHELGYFHCEEIHVVNGAQTVSTIGQYLAKNPAADLSSCFVQFRVIELGDGGEEFGDEVTRTNNRQNRIEARDFVSQDPEQKRLRNELLIEGIQYQIMRGEDQGRGEKTFNLHDSTTALACASGDVALVVTLKAQIGKIWEDLSKSPYKSLFNPSVSGLHVWHCVQIQRSIDEAIDQRKRQIVKPRDQRILTSGNRLIASLVFGLIPLQRFSDPTVNYKNYVTPERVGSAVDSVSTVVFEFMNQFHPKAMIPTFFKNQTKCRELHSWAARKHAKSQIFNISIT